MPLLPRSVFALLLTGSIQCAAIKKTPLNKYYYFQYTSIFFCENFSDYSGQNLPLLLRILSSQLSLFRSSTCLNIKYDFFQLHRQINQTTTNFQAYFKHKIRLIVWNAEKLPVISRWKQKYQLLSSLDYFTVYIQSVRLLRWCKRADACGSWRLIFW